MSDNHQDYRSYLLRLYRVRKGGGTRWRASLQSSQGGRPLHFRSLSEMVDFLEQEDDPRRSVGEQDPADEVAADKS